MKFGNSAVAVGLIEEMKNIVLNAVINEKRIR